MTRNPSQSTSTSTNHDRSPKPASQAAAQGAQAEKVRYNVMQPVHREGRDKPFWQRLGTAWANPAKNGGPASISVRLDALPLGGELVMFVADDSDDAE